MAHSKAPSFKIGDTVQDNRGRLGTVTSTRDGEYRVHWGRGDAWGPNPEPHYCTHSAGDLSAPAPEPTPEEIAADLSHRDAVNLIELAADRDHMTRAERVDFIECGFAVDNGDHCTISKLGREVVDAMTTVRVSHFAADLDAMEARELGPVGDGSRGLVITKITKGFVCLTGTRTAVLGQAEVFWQVSDARSMAREASELAVTRRAARSIYKQLDEPLPFGWEPRKRRSPRRRRRVDA